MFPFLEPNKNAQIGYLNSHLLSSCVQTFACNCTKSNRESLGGTTQKKDFFLIVLFSFPASSLYKCVLLFT